MLDDQDRLRILVLAQHVGSNGGTGAHVAHSIDALVRRGHQVAVGTMEKAESLRTDADVRLIPGLGRIETSSAARTRLAELVKAVRPDVVHVQQLQDPDLIPSIRQHSPLVFNVHNFVGCPSGAAYFREPGDECGRAHGSGCIPRWLLRGCAHSRDPRDLPAKYRHSAGLIAAVRSADVAVAHSSYVARHLENNGVHEPAVVPLFVPANGAPTQPASPPRVLFSGRVTAAKGVDTFLRAASAVDAEFHVCGDGWWAPAARRLAKRLGVDGRVRFNGWLEDSELAAAYDAATIVVVPSHWPEPVGLVGLEGMAHRRPVVGSATGGIPEWLADGDTGLLVRPGDPEELTVALLRLLADPAAMRRMGAAGAARIEREFSEERYLTGIESAYRHARGRWQASRS